jgi:hypothetical protein
MGQGDGKGLAVSVLMLLVCPLTLIGCVSIEHYPASWDAISQEPKSSDCGGVAGAYKNTGEDKEARSILLATWLDPTLNHWRTPERDRLEHDLASALQMELGFTHGRLQITAIGPGVQREWSYRYKCRRGRIHIPRRGDMSGDNVAVVGSDVLELYRLKNYLVVNRHGAEAGVALLIPFAVYGSSWARFPAVEKQGPDLNGTGSPVLSAPDEGPL